MDLIPKKMFIHGCVTFSSKKFRPIAKSVYCPNCKMEFNGYKSKYHRKYLTLVTCMFTANYSI